jgi:hypothetical protein
VLNAFLKEGTIIKLTFSTKNFPLINNSVAILALATKNIKICGPKVQTLKLFVLSPKHRDIILAIELLESRIPSERVTVQSLTGDQSLECALTEDAVEIWNLERTKF